MSRKSRSSIRTEDTENRILGTSSSSVRVVKTVATNTRKLSTPNMIPSSSKEDSSAKSASSKTCKNASVRRKLSTPDMLFTDRFRKEESLNSSKTASSTSSSSSSSSTSRAVKNVTMPKKVTSAIDVMMASNSSCDRCRQPDKNFALSRKRVPDSRCSCSENVSEEPPQQEESIILTEEQKAELKQAFSMFEKAGKGRIQARDLGELLRCLGWNPSEQDLEEARHELEVSGVSARGTISFADVEAYVARRGGIYYGNNAEEDILVAFQVLDKSGNGKIEVEEFRHFMTTMGERMTNEEVEDLLKSANREGHDFIEYKDLMRAMQQHPT